jgi:hypothetical protein
MAHLKRVINFTLFFCACFNPEPLVAVILYPDKSTHHKTKPDTPCHPSKYSIFSRYLWTGLFPQPFNFNDL